MATRLLTIGHSTRTLDEFLALLRAHEVERVVDVGSLPRSTRMPHARGPPRRAPPPALAPHAALQRPVARALARRGGSRLHAHSGSRWPKGALHGARVRGIAGGVPRLWGAYGNASLPRGAR